MTMPAGNLIGGNLVTPNQPTVSQYSEVAPNLLGVASAYPTGNKILRKFSAVSDAAKNRNGVISVPLIPPPAWVASTQYYTGYVVQNGGNQYICHISGVSAGSGGPAGTGVAPITDGAATWYYQSGVRTTTTSIDAPVVSFATSAPAGLTKQYTIAANLPSYFVSGAVPISIGGGAYRFAADTVLSGGNATSTRSGFSGGFVIETDAPKIAVNTVIATNVVIVEVDDVRIYDGSITVAQSTLATNQYMTLDFSAAGRRKRKIRFYVYGNFNLYDVRVDPLSMIWAYTNANMIRMAVVGDSLTAGGNGFPLDPGLDWPQQCARILGIDDCWNLGQGGTGFINNLSGAALTYIQRFSDLTDAAPDILVIAGNANDTSYTVAAQQDAVLTYLHAVRAALPNTVIVVFGPNPEATGPSAAVLAADGAMSAAVAAFADPLTYFQSITSGPSGSWMTGTGKVTAPNGSGNTDVYTSSDGVHPVQGGIDYLARRYAAALRSALTL